MYPVKHCLKEQRSTAQEGGEGLARHRNVPTRVGQKNHNTVRGQKGQILEGDIPELILYLYQTLVGYLLTFQWGGYPQLAGVVVLLYHTSQLGVTTPLKFH